MEYIGIEIRKGSWQVAHLKGTLAGLKVVHRLSLDSGDAGERIEGLRDYISKRHVSDPVISVALAREMSFSRILSIPAPKEEDISAILRFEAEKHLPFAPEEFRYSHSVIERKGNIHTVLLSGAKKDGLERLLKEFTGAGLKPSCVASPQAAVLNGLEHIGALSPGKSIAFVHVSLEEASIDTFSGPVPVYSRAVPKGKGFAERLKRDLKLAAFAHNRLDNKGLDECVVCFDGAVEEDLADMLSEAAGTGAVKVWAENRAPEASPAAIGAALAASGKGKAAGLLSLEGGVSKKASYAFTAAAASVAALLLVLAGASYIARDLLAIRGLKGAVASVNGESEETRKTLGDYKKLSAKVALLEEIGGMSGPGVLDALEETVKALPERTRLTNFETSGGGVRIEGTTDSASSLILTLEERSDFLEQAEMSGPAVKASDGKERFMLGFRIKGAPDKTNEGARE